MSKGDHENAGKSIPPAALEAMRYELLLGTPASGNSGRFRKGQSGNPKGRPKRAERPQPVVDASGILATILKEAERPIPIRDGGKLSQISAREAVARALYATAVKGHPYALRTVIEMLGRAERDEAREVAEEHELFEAYRARCWKEIEEAKAKGVPLPTPLPHPDDIIIEPGKRVRFIGPLDESEAAKLDRTCQLRDILLMQDALDQKLAVGGDIKPGGALLCALVLNQLLPGRMQLSDDAILFRQMRHETTPKRTLLKDLYQAWRDLGVALPRGWAFPPLEFVEERLRLYCEFFAAARAGELDVAAMAHGEFDENAREFMARWA